MMSNSVKILLVEHNPDDIELILDELKNAEISFISEIVQQEQDYTVAIKNFMPDIILSDYSLPSFDGPRALEIRETIAPGIPFLFVSGSIGEERSIEYIRNGVTDYVLKEKLFTLGVKVKRALNEAKEQKEKISAEKALALSESLLARAQQLAHLGSWELNFDDNELGLSVEGAKIFGCPPGQNRLSYKTWSSLVHPDDIDDIIQTIQQARDTLTDTTYYHRIMLKDGTVKHIYSESKFDFDVNGKAVGLYGTMQDVTERKKSEAATKKAYDEMNTVLESIDDGFFALDKDSVVTYWNKRAEILLDTKKEDLIGKNLHEVFTLRGSRIFYDNYVKALKEKITINFEGFSNLSKKWFAVSAFGSDNGLSVYFKDVTERKISENKLKESELRYRSIIEQATDAICIADSSMKIIDINPEGCQMLGYSKEEFLQLSVTDLFPAEDLRADPFKIAELKVGGIIRNERRFKTKDGTLIEIELSARILEDGKFLVFGHDIAERKKADNKIRESEWRYRLLNEQATDAICIADASMRFIDINPYACEILGYTKEEGLQLALPDILFAEDLTENPIKFKELQLGKTMRNERRLKRKDGTAVDMEVSTRLMEDGRMIMFGHDITERKKGEQLISESEKRYRQIVETSQEGIWLIDENNKTTFVNSKICELLEYTEEEMTGKSIFCFMDEKGKALTADFFRRKQERQASSYQFRYFTKHGKAIWTNISANPIFTEDGTYKGSLGMITDITERKKDEEKLRKANRLYTFISQVNQSIVHIKDEAELFRNSCQIAFEFGKFKIAWVGIIDKAAHKITLADQNGIPVEDIPVFTNANYERNGPVDHVLRTGTYYLCNDVQQDPAVQSRKPLAAKHGIQSVIVLPVKKSGQIIGTFNLYASELNFFDSEEIKLLTDVAEDISFALDIFENAKKQKKTEELVLKNERRFRALIEKSVDMKTLSTREGEMIYGSPSIMTVLGYSPEEFCHRSAFEMIHPDDIPGYREKRKEILNIPGKSFYSQNRFLHKNGSWIWCEGNVTNMLHEPGVHALVSNFKDISEIKLAEQQKEFDRNNLNALINNTRDLMWSLDRAYKLITFNQPFFDVIKLYSGKELIKGGDVFDAALSQVQADRFKKAYSRAFSGETFTEIEHIEAPFESWSEISYYPICKGEEVIGTACHSRNITERKKAEINLAQSEKKYRQIVETAQEGIWLIDENNKTTFVNKKMCELLEYTGEEMLGRTNLSFKDEEEQKKTLLKIERRKKGIWEIHESTFITKSGRTICTQVSTNPLLDDNGTYMGALAMMTDITERKRAEQEMTWLINNTEESFILLNRNLEIISFNSQFYRHYLKYLAINVVKGDSILKYAQPERLDIVKGIYKRVLEGAQETGEINIELPGNAVKIFAIKYKPAKDEQGKIIGVFVSAIDITEKKESEKKLIIQEKRYRALVENGADGVVILSPEGKLSYASPTVEKILGYTEEETGKLDMFSIMHPDDIEAMTKVWEKVLASSGVAIPGHTGRMLHKNGSWRWLEATVTNMLHDPALNGIVDNFRDVTEKKELENLLNKTNSLARIGSWEIDLVKNSLYWSDITKEIHEAENDFIPDLQTAINFYKEGENRDTITQKVQDAIDNGLPFDAELQIITAKGNEKWVRAIGETEFTNGKAAKVSGSFQDITDRKLAAIRLNELNKNLKKQTKELAISNAELEQFAYVASHDLQEPLRMITSFLTQLEKKYGTVIDAKGKLYIDFAVDGAKRMRQIILDLLEFSKVGKTADSLENIDLNELVDEIKILFRKKIEEKNAQIIVDPLPQILADRTPMRQVFQNLVSNALKYSVSDKPSQIHISAKDFQTHWQFAVSDNGIGIAGEYFDKIFIIFQRLHNKDEFSGTGMGLAVTKKIIENLGGKIWLESEEGKGTTFYFTILKQALI